MNVLEARDLFFEYPDGYKALNGISIVMAKGDFIGLLGPNGCGKTTLFQTFNGLLKPTAGEIFIKGMNIKQWPENELYKTVGLVFQNPDDQLFAPTVFEDVSYGLVNMGLKAVEIKSKVEKALKILKMWDDRKRPIHSLSFGQKKRVAVAGVLAMEPELLILDEPTAGLDPMGISELMKLLQQAQKDFGLSVILSTHDIDLVPLYCDRAYVMEKGQIKMEGTPQQIFAEPEAIRGVNLRMPRIGHLMEILKKEDHFDLKDTAVTIGQARQELKKWGKLS
jgi:cobalt transport protein ATP-binding subunit